MIVYVRGIGATAQEVIVLEDEDQALRRAFGADSGSAGDDEAFTIKRLKKNVSETELALSMPMGEVVERVRTTLAAVGNGIEQDRDMHRYAIRAIVPTRRFA